MRIMNRWSLRTSRLAGLTALLLLFPVSNMAQQVLDLIRSLCTEVNTTLLLVSHDLAVTSQFPRVLHLAEINRPAKKMEPQMHAGARR